MLLLQENSIGCDAQESSPAADDADPVVPGGPRVSDPRDAMGHLKATGVLVGGIALGQRRIDEIDEDGRKVIVEDEAERDTVRRIIDLRLQGTSFRAIAASLSVEGRPTKRGGRWAPTTVCKIAMRASAHATA
jgi:hypothetical protein